MNQVAETESAESEYLGIGGVISEMIKVFLFALVIIIPVRVFLFQPFFVQGSSMEPNFHDAEYLVVNEFGYKNTTIKFGGIIDSSLRPFRSLERQDVVVFRYPKNPEQFFIKRIIGLPGESVEIRQGKVLIYNTDHPDGYVLNESDYLGANVLTTDMEKTEVGMDAYFVMGDNRMSSYDSRALGPIKKDKVIGRVVLRAWPVDKFTVY